MKNVRYFDHAAGTPCDRRALSALVQAAGAFGNPSSPHSLGRLAAEVLRVSRERVARFLGARPDEVVFTSSGSEANAMAVSCVLDAAPRGIRNIVTTPIEHPSLLNSVSAHINGGQTIGHVRVNSEGSVDTKHLERLITSRTVLVSVIYANNEIGTIEPISKIGKLIRAYRRKHGSIYPLFHTDACQAAEYLDMNVRWLGVDLMTFNGAKIYGPRGVGALYVRRGTPAVPWIRGGRQEQGMRAGTENVPAIAGFARALDLVDRSRAERQRGLQDYFMRKIMAALPDAKINGPMFRNRLPNNIHISIPGLGSDLLLVELDRRGVVAGKGSACTAHSVEPSHVLKAIGVKEPYLSGALRFSLGRTTTRSDIDAAVAALVGSVSALRRRFGAQRTLKD